MELWRQPASVAEQRRIRVHLKSSVTRLRMHPASKRQAKKEGVERFNPLFGRTCQRGLAGPLDQQFLQRFLQSVELVDGDEPRL